MITYDKLYYNGNNHPLHSHEFSRFFLYFAVLPSFKYKNNTGNSIIAVVVTSYLSSVVSGMEKHSVFYKGKIFMGNYAVSAK